MKCILLLLFMIFLPVNIFAQNTKQKPLNPDIGVNLLTLYQNSKEGNSSDAAMPNGFSLQALELQFSADVDPFFRMQLNLGIHKEAAGHHDDEHGEEAEEAEAAEGTEEGHEEAHGYIMEPEEAFIETLAIPGVTVRMGKVFAELGDHNLLHLHAYPFIYAPLVSEGIFGSEGFKSIGLSAAALLPLPWFSEVTVQALEDDTELFSSENANEVVSILKLRNLFELSNTLTFDLGLSGADGKNTEDESSQIYAVDFSFKSQFQGSQGWEFSGEYLTSKTTQLEQDIEKSGYYSDLSYRMTRDFSAKYRYESFNSEVASETVMDAQAHSLMFGYFPSEFSAIRLQLRQLHHEDEDPELQLAIQGNMSIGAHPAHRY